jgi:hypothetical protein
VDFSPIPIQECSSVSAATPRAPADRKKFSPNRRSPLVALAALDAEFDSESNRLSGKMKLQEYQTKRAALEAEPDPSPTPASEPSKFISMKIFKHALEEVAKIIRERFEKTDERVAEIDARAPSFERVARLEARVAELEQQKTAYRGVWNDGDTYSRGDITTDRGTIWFCHEATSDRPGQSSSWQLMVKNVR